MIWGSSFYDIDQYLSLTAQFVIKSLHDTGCCNYEPTLPPSTEHPRNLGVLFDSTCSLKYHVNTLCKSCNYNIYNNGKIRKYLDRPTTELLVNTVITSKLDYCNSLLYGLPKYLIKQLQRCHNNAAKMLLLTYKSLFGQGPMYLHNLLEYPTGKRALRSSDKQLLAEPPYRLDTFGARSFQCAAPRLWNNLPQHLGKEQPGATDIIRLNNFKKLLKTYLFAKAYYE